MKKSNNHMFPGCLTVMLFVLFTCFSATAFAVEEPYVNELKGAQVAADKSFTVSDEKFNSSTSWALIQQNISVDDIVSFELNFDTSIYFYNQPFNCTINFKIYIYGNQSDTSQITDSTTHANINLEIRYDTVTGKPYKGIALYKFRNAHKFKVKIISITSPQLSPIPAIFRVKGQIIVNRKYNWNDNSSDVTRFTVLNGNQLKLEWTPSLYPGAEMFDLEYTYIDRNSQMAASIGSYTFGANYNVPADTLAKWFVNNSTRITTAAAAHLINMPYDSGYIIFRIRGVQIHYPDELRWEGNWNYIARPPGPDCGGSTDPCPTAVVRFDGHEQNLNWQFSISFAEEGKQKIVTSYFSGLLHNRQSVTINNTDNKTVVQETIYDALGRSAASILPAPTNDSTIHYFRGFNKNKNGNPYSFSDLLYGSGCTTTADSVSHVSGTGNYYSTSNVFQGTYRYAKYIPNAGGYPFTVTEYMADNTGRIKALGGVGDSFQLHTNHATKYFYGKPTQTELDRLFGSEAGNASHYLKNMVQDANGQISVSYQDASGKTIATALAGATPPNVHDLPSNTTGTAVQVSNDLIKPGDFSRNPGDYSLSASATFLAAATGTYVFNYRVDPLVYQKLYGPDKDSVICSDCYYDLEITVKDDCNNLIDSVGLSTGAVFDTACANQPDTIQGTMNVTLNKIGEYYITYTLRLSQDALNFYDSVHLVKNSDIKKINYFLLEELKETDFYGCYSNCETCFDKLGTKPEFVKTFKSFYQADSLVFGTADSLWAIALYDSLYSNCQAIQVDCHLNVCDEKLAMLKLDVSPGGQYALYDSTYNLLERPINRLDTAWRNQILFFTNELGIRDSIVIYNTDGDDSVKVDVKDLSDSLFIKNWKDVWADSLVRLHPEYCYYLWCLANSTSYEFDRDVENLMDADTAIAKGWFDPAVYYKILDADPFFAGGSNIVRYTKMKRDLQFFSRRYMRNALGAKNILQFIDVVLYCKTQPNGWNACNPDSACRSRNREWFLYKTLYLNLKQKYYEEARRTNPQFANCTNCHIGGDIIDDTESHCIKPPTSSFILRGCIENGLPVSDCMEYYYPAYETLVNPIILKYRYSNALCPGGCIAYVTMNPGDSAAQLPFGNIATTFTLLEILCDDACIPPPVSQFVLGGAPSCPPGFDESISYVGTNPISHSLILRVQRHNFIANTDDTVSVLFPANQLYQCYSVPHIYSFTQIVEVLCDTSYVPFTDSTCNTYCPGGIYNPYDRDSISYYVEYGNPNTAPSGTPPNYGNCQFYPAFELYTGPTTSCRFFNVWVCEYDSACGGICPPDSVCTTGTAYYLKKYGGNKDDFSYHSVPSHDNGYVIAGQTNSFGSGGYDGLLTKVDGEGNVVWSKAVGGTGNDFFDRIIRTTDNGFMVCGQTKSYGNTAGDVWLVKFDASGSVQWSKKYGDGNVNGEMAYDVIQLSDGGYAFCGVHQFAGGVAQSFVVRTDNQGNAVWSKQYGNNLSDDATGLLEDGNSLLVTGFYQGTSFYEGYLMKLTTSNGAVEWINGYDAENRSTWFNKISKTNSGYQVFSIITDNYGDQNQQECIWNLDTDGTVQDIRKLAIPGNWTISYGWHPLSDGGFIGVNGANNSGSDVIICHVDASGNVDWSKKYNTTGKQQISSIVPMPGGGYACAGINNNPGTVADSNDVYVMRIDEFGDAGSCSGASTTDLTVVTPSYTTPASNVVDIGTVTIVNPVITVGVVSFTASSNTLCSSCLLQPADDFPSSCIGTGTDTLYKHKQRRYPEYVNPKDLLNQISNGNPQQGSSQSEQDIINECKNTCEAQADYWLRVLNRCNISPADSVTLRAALVDICSKGCAINTPFGVSSLPSSVPATYHSFEEAIEAILGPNAINDSCTAELLAMPYPHDRQPVVVERVIIETDYAICQRLGQFRTAYFNSGFAGSMHQFMLNTYGSAYTLDSTELDDMLNACLNCNGILKDDIVLPVLFDPQSRPCLKCDSVTVVFAAFNAKFPGIAVTDDDYENLFANFFNHRFGFALTYDDYQTFLDSCTAHPGFPGQLCNGPVSEDVELNDNSCILELFKTALTNATYTYIAYIDSVRRDFREAWLTKCMNVQPVLNMTASLYEYHYTLYYYDQSDNLVKTVPPEGVRFLTPAEIQLVQQKRSAGNNSYCNNSNSMAFGVGGGAVIFTNGASSQLNTGNQPFTIEYWLKLNSFNNQGILSNNWSFADGLGGFAEKGYAVKIKNGRLVLLMGEGITGVTGIVEVQTLPLSGLVSLNSWNHFALERTNTGSGVKIYINGNDIPVSYLKNNFVSGNIDNNIAGGFYTGAAYTDGALQSLVNGNLKHLRIYKRAVPQTELRQNCFDFCGNPGNSNAMVFWETFNEGVWASGPIPGLSYVYDRVFNLSGYAGGSAQGFEIAAGSTVPEHRLVTTYQHNSFDQIVQQYNPDGDTSVFFYDRLGRLTVMQNMRQLHEPSYDAVTARYLYTKYDQLGRKIEVGEKSGSVADIRTIDMLDASAVSNWLQNGTDKQLTKTVYDNPVNLGLQNIGNSRKRIVASIYLDNSSDTEGDSTLYIYDLLGNVKTVVQHIKSLVAIESENGRKRIDYDYDLVSGKVNTVSYQAGKGDQFFYKYFYDAELKPTRSLSSRDKLIWIEDASYDYYLHGPLARMELGQYKVQGVDYAYTLQGWVKGINSNVLNPQYEIGQDGWPGTTFERVSRDVYSYGLGYYNKDYTAIGGSGAPAIDQAVYQHPSGADNTGRPLFNGNISHTEVAMTKIDNGAAKGYTYGFDQLSRLVFMNQHAISGTTWNNTSILSAYAESIAYDGNGNILKYLRKGANSAGLPLDMDSMNYKYNRDANGNLVDNRLNHVRDQVSASNYTIDIDDQLTNNYTYDRTGNLKTDVAENIGNIDWTVYGKIKKIEKPTSTIEYGYDPSGNRSSKKVIISGGQIDEELNTWYIRDVQGNVLAVYSKKQNNPVKWDEQHLYGSERLGIWQWDTIVPAEPPVVGSFGTPIYDSLLCGSRTYELGNHLGNVLTTISDKKVGHNNGSGVVDYYLADVLSANDYYPFGMLQPGREYSVGDAYRFGYNGKENDNEVKGEGNQLDYGLRIYDPRLGRFLSVDPMWSGFAWWTPYQYAGNSPVGYIDLDGAELSKKLSNIGIKLGPISAGFLDGFVDNFGFLSALKFGWNMLTDSEYRNNFLDAIATIASDPVAFAEMIVEEYKEKALSIARWDKQGKYDAGYLVGELVGGILSGGAVAKFIKYAKGFDRWKLTKRINNIIQKYGLKKIVGNPCGCFTDDVKVLTADGLKSIAELKDGDLVWAYNDTTHVYELKPIYNSYNLVSDSLYTIITNYDTIKVTQDHPFLTQRGWVETYELQETDILATKNSGFVTIKKISKTVDYQIVYNFAVEDYHTFIISKGNIIVHNSLGACEIINKVKTKKGEFFGFYRILKKKNKDNTYSYYVGKGPESRAEISKVAKDGKSFDWWQVKDENTALMYEHLLMEKYGGPGSNKLPNNVNNSPGKTLFESKTLEEQKIIRQEFEKAFKEKPTKSG